MTAIGRWATAFLLAGILPASAETLVATLSTDSVEISSTFTGTAITLFGAIEQDGGGRIMAEEYDLAVVVRGPSQSAVTRRKERWFGVFVNRAAETYVAVPAFYTAHLSRPAALIAERDVLSLNQIGLSSIALTNPDTGIVAADFRDAFVRLKAEDGLYSEATGDIERLGANLFQTNIRLPANTPVGRYTAVVYLLGSGTVLAKAERGFVVDKSGFEQLTSGFARSQSLLYGIFCIGLALLTGYLAGVIFRRD